MFDKLTPPARQMRLYNPQPLTLREYIRERLRGFELRQRDRDERRRAKNKANRRRVK